jgi:hypothetical protein
MPPDPLAQLKRLIVHQALPAIGAELLRPGDDEAALGPIHDASLILLYTHLLAGDATSSIPPRDRRPIQLQAFFDPRDHPRFRAALDLLDQRDPDLDASMCHLAAALPGPLLANLSARAIGEIHESLLAFRLRFASTGLGAPRDAIARAHRPHMAPDDGRKTAGAFYTPAPVVDHLIRTTVTPIIERAIARMRDDPARAADHLPRILDPTAGAGHFLLASADAIVSALEHLHADDATLLAGPIQSTRELDPAPSAPIDDLTAIRRLVITHCIHAVDIDPFGVALTRALLARAARAPLPALRANIVIADALDARLPAHPGPRNSPGFDWPTAFPRVFAHHTRPPGFDAVVGNPPFLSQLAAATARPRRLAARLRDLHPGAALPYTDTAALFLLSALHLAAAGARISLVQPQSLLSSRDARGVRTACFERARLVSLWVAGEPVFPDVTALVCAPCFELSPAQGDVTITTGADIRHSLTVHARDVPNLTTDTWVPLIAPALGIPSVSVPSHRTLADVAEATADFRDQYYALVGRIIEDDDCPDDPTYPPLITTGLIDLASRLWSHIPATFARQRWSAPRVDLARLRNETDQGTWAAKRLVPKLLVATQTPIIELIVDEHARDLPMVPIITVTARADVSLWALGAAIASPVACAIALSRYAGAALTTRAIKLSARQLLDLPIPDLQSAQLIEAADLLRAASNSDDDAQRRHLLRDMARLTCDAHDLGTTDEHTLMNWWLDRFPRPKLAASEPATT